MFDFLQWIRVKRDIAPGTLVYAGEDKNFTPNIKTVAYDGQTISETSMTNVEDISIIEGMTNFIHVQGVHNPDLIRNIGTRLNLPLLALEDVLNTGQRPKIAWVDDETGFIVMKNIRIKNEQVATEQISIFWRPGCVILFSEDETDLLNGIFTRLHKGKKKIRKGGSDYLTTAILDALVDRQLYALSEIGNLAEIIEADLLERPTDKRLEQLYEVKRETILLRNSLMPVQDIFKTLLRDDSGMSEETLPYLQDVSGHHSQAFEGTVALHDILKSMIDYQISLIGMRTNKVMQFLTAVATIFIPLTFIAGIYGMNFQYMPELQWRYGYFIILGVMGISGAAMLFYFIKKKLL